MNKIFGPKLNGYNFQDSGNAFMDNIIYFHDIVLCILFFILFLVTWFLVKTLLYFGNHSLTYELYYTKYSFKYYLLNKRNEIHRKLLKWGKTPKTSDLYTMIVLNELSFLDKFVSITQYFKKYNLEYRYYFYSDVKLEFIWTLFPSIVLLLLAIPSFGLLFSVEKVSAPELTVKVIGHQWYWEYQYMDYINVNEKVDMESYVFSFKNKTEDNYIVESYMVADDDLAKGQFRLLEVDKKLILPRNTSIRLLITSDDVLHSWSIPGLGIKVDACPGRLNEIIINIRNIGLYYGQCSELCGWYHGFMPIVIQSLNPEDFRIWAVSTFMDVKYIAKDSPLLGGNKIEGDNPILSDSIEENNSIVAENSEEEIILSNNEVNNENQINEKVTEVEIDVELENNDVNNLSEERSELEELNKNHEIESNENK